MWRATTDATWTHVIPVGKRTSYTAKGLSKDNVYFGIRAIDRAGNRSPAAFPVPARADRAGIPAAARRNAYRGRGCYSMVYVASPL